MRFDDYVHMKDIMPTILDLMGIKTEHQVRRPQPRAAVRGQAARAGAGVLHHRVHVDAQARLADARVEVHARAGAGFPLQAGDRALQPADRPRGEQQRRQGEPRGREDARGAHAELDRQAREARPAAPTRSTPTSTGTAGACRSRARSRPTTRCTSARPRPPRRCRRRSFRRSGGRRNCDPRNELGATHCEVRLRGLGTIRGVVMVRVCVIGLGPIGNLHADIYKADALAELVGVCDIIEERARRAGERLGVPWFTERAGDACRAEAGYGAASRRAGSNTPAITSSRPFRRSKRAATCCARSRSAMRSTRPQRWFGSRGNAIGVSGSTSTIASRPRRGSRGSGSMKASSGR